MKKGPRPVAREVEGDEIDAPPGLEDTSFLWTREKERRRLILAIDGLEGDGKTHLAFTAPDPICYMFIDRRHEGVISKPAFKNKIIGTAEYRVNTTANAQDQQAENAEAAWERFKRDYLTALRAKVRSVIWDTASEFWELCRLARFGKLTQVKPFHYGPVNAEFRDLIREALNYDVNLLLLHKMGKEYVDDSWSGNYSRKGFSDSGFLVQAAVTTKFDVEDKVFRVTVTKSGLDPELRGFDWENPTFLDIASTLVPGSKASDWE